VGKSRCQNGTSSLKGDLIEDDVLHAGLHGLSRRQETAPDSVGDRPKAQVDASWLDVLGRDAQPVRVDQPLLYGFPKALIGQYACVAGGQV